MCARARATPRQPLLRHETHNDALTITHKQCWGASVNDRPTRITIYSVTKEVFRLLIRPPETLVPEGLITDVFFISPLDLRAPSADRRETFTVISIGTDFIMQVQKLGCSPLKKFGGQNHAKICGDFTQLPTLIADISEKTQDIQNRKAN